MSRKKQEQEQDAGVMFTPARLYDEKGKEIGVTDYRYEAVVYAMSQSKRIKYATPISQMFGKECIKRDDIPQSVIDKVSKQKKYGENLLFWVGKPLVVNK